MSFKLAWPMTFLLFFAMSTSLIASELTNLTRVENQSLQKVVTKAERYFDFFSSTPGSCTGLTLFSFERSQGLIQVARKAVNKANPGYDSPRSMSLRYLGVLDDASESFVLSLEGLMGGRQQSFVRRYFERQDDQQALNRYWRARDTFQKILGELSRSSRVLVYSGDKENSFTRSDFLILMDPAKKELALFQAGWCE